MTGDTITVMTSLGPLATKTVRAIRNGPPKITGYGKAS
jgi:hypothetical protein